MAHGSWLVAIIQLRTMQTTTILSLTLTILVGSSGEGDGYEIPDYFEGSSVVTYGDQRSAVAAASREDVCTLILYGAPWDGHFKMFVPTWKGWAEALKNNDRIELGFFAYSGSSDGPMSIPTELYPVPTIASYDWYAYRGGEMLWSAASGYNTQRMCLSEGSMDFECIRRYCFDQREEL